MDFVSNPLHKAVKQRKEDLPQNFGVVLLFSEHECTNSFWGKKKESPKINVFRVDVKEWKDQCNLKRETFLYSVFAHVKALNKIIVLNKF